MKPTSITRKIDTVGRVLLPIEIRRGLNITTDTSLEIFIDDYTLILRTYNPGCIICESMDITKEFKGKKVCRKCIEEFTE